MDAFYIKKDAISTDVPSLCEKGTPRINLSTSEDIRREMGRVYREARNRKLPANEATKLTYILMQMLKATEVYILEERFSALELTYSGGAK